MPYFKDSENKLHFIDDVIFEACLPPGCILIADEEAAALIPASPPNQEIDAQIAALEGKTERGVREAMLYVLVAIAASQGLNEPQLYVSNFGYRKAKDLDSQIAALRARRV